MVDELGPDVVSDEDIAAAVGEDLPEPLAADGTSDVDADPALDPFDLPENY